MGFELAINILGTLFVMQFFLRQLLQFNSSAGSDIS
jgi:hypothetical protein